MTSGQSLGSMTSGQSTAGLYTSGQSRGAGDCTFVVRDSRGAVMPVINSSSGVSPKTTGATVHHHGPSTDPSFAHLRSQLQHSATLQAPAGMMPTVLAGKIH